VLQGSSLVYFDSGLELAKAILERLPVTRIDDLSQYEMQMLNLFELTTVTAREILQETASHSPLEGATEAHSCCCKDMAAKMNHVTEQLERVETTLNGLVSALKICGLIAEEAVALNTNHHLSEELAQVLPLRAAAEAKGVGDVTHANALLAQTERSSRVYDFVSGHSPSTRTGRYDSGPFTVSDRVHHREFQHSGDRLTLTPTRSFDDSDSHHTYEGHKVHRSGTS
jgi:hypothetical protein